MIIAIIWFSSGPVLAAQHLRTVYGKNSQRQVCLLQDVSNESGELTEPHVSGFKEIDVNLGRRLYMNSAVPWG